MKRLLIGFIFVAALRLIPTPAAENKGKQDPKGNTSLSRESEERIPVEPTVTQKAFFNCEPSKQDSNPQTASAPYQPRKWIEWINAISTVVIAIFAVITAIAVGLQVKTARNSERAWILGTPSLKSKLRVGAPRTGFVFTWSFKNVGRTPARLVETDAVSWRVKDVKTIPKTPKFEGKPVPLNNFLLVPNDSIGFGGLVEPFGDELTREEIDEITGMKLTLIAFGYVTYLDQFGKKHTTRFCHTYMVGGPDSEGFRPYWSAPSAYTECD